ncbi:RPL35, partial [Symbiodinium pilosum]
VGRAVEEEVYDAPIPEKEKRAIVAQATLAAANAESPGRLMNGTGGLPKDVVRDLLSLSWAARAAGFSSEATAAMKFRWQDMSPQQRAVARKVLVAAAAARGQTPHKGPSSADRVASVVRALEDAGVPAREEATFAEAALRSEEAPEEASEVGPLSKTILDDIVDLAKHAGLSRAQQSGILQAVAPLQPEERRAVATVWAAVGDRAEKRREARAPDATEDAHAASLESLNVLVFAAMQVGATAETIDKVNALAQSMTPEAQMAAAAAVLATRKAPAPVEPLSVVSSISQK